MIGRAKQRAGRLARLSRLKQIIKQMVNLESLSSNLSSRSFSLFLSPALSCSCSLLPTWTTGDESQSYARLHIEPTLLLSRHRSLDRSSDFASQPELGAARLVVALTKLKNLSQSLELLASRATCVKCARLARKVPLRRGTLRESFCAPSARPPTSSPGANWRGKPALNDNNNNRLLLGPNAQKQIGEHVASSRRCRQKRQHQWQQWQSVGSSMPIITLKVGNFTFYDYHATQTQAHTVTTTRSPLRFLFLFLFLPLLLLARQTNARPESQPPAACRLHYPLCALQSDR